MVDYDQIVDEEGRQGFEDKDFSNGIGLNLWKFALAVLLDISLAEDMFLKGLHINLAFKVRNIFQKGRECEIGIKLDVGLSSQGRTDQSLDNIDLVEGTFEGSGSFISWMLCQILKHFLKSGMRVFSDHLVDEGWQLVHCW